MYLSLNRGKPLQLNKRTNSLFQPRPTRGGKGGGKVGELKATTIRPTRGGKIDELIKAKTIRRTCVSRYHLDSIEGSLKPLKHHSKAIWYWGVLLIRRTICFSRVRVCKVGELAIVLTWSLFWMWLLRVSKTTTFRPL